MDNPGQRSSPDPQPSGATKRRDIPLAADPTRIPDKTNVGYRTPSPSARGSASEETLPVAPPNKADYESQVSLGGSPRQGPSSQSSLRPPEEPGEIGRLGTYRVLGILGTGGMGVVYQAEDLVLRRPVALKVIRPDLQEKEEGWHRLQREARAMASIKHENLITIYQAGQEGDVFYLAMELLEGETLDARLHRTYEPMSNSEIVRLAREMANGLSAIHKHGMIHRDLKPSNIWLEAPNAKARILDFGLARHMSKSDRSNLTQAGTLVGTPAYMSPEQARGENLDARSDLFSLGCVLYCLCSGRPPFKGESLIAQLTALALDDPQPLREVNPELPDSLADLIGLMLTKKPAGRPASAEEVIAALNAIESGIAPTLIGARPSSNSKRDSSNHPPPAARSYHREGIALAATVVLAVVVGVMLARPGKTPQGNPGDASKIALANPDNGKVSKQPEAKPPEVKTPEVKTPEPKPPEPKPPEIKPPEPKPVEIKPEPKPPEIKTTEIKIPIEKKPEVPTVVALNEDPPERPRDERRPPKDERRQPPEDRDLPDDREPRAGAGDEPTPEVMKMLKAQAEGGRKPLRIYALDLPFGDTASAYFPKGSGKEKYNDRMRPPNAYANFIVFGETSPHAIGTHPAPAGREGFVELKLDGKFKKFYAVVSQNDGVPAAASAMTFAVYGDNKELWRSKPFKSQKGTEACPGINVSGVKILSLEITTKGSPNAAHGIWFQPYLEK